MLIKRILPLSITLFLVTVFFPVSSFAVHKGAGGLVCGQCHTMHNSQGRMNLQHGNDRSADPAMLLLRANVGSRSQVHRLCLQCHGDNGAMAEMAQKPHGQKAPKVYSSAVWNQEMSFDSIGAGGNFAPELDSSWDLTTPNYLGFGHSLGATNVDPPGGDNTIDDFSCTNCHDPHGTDDPKDPKINIFRNLKVFPLGAEPPGSINSGVKFIAENVEPWFINKSYVGGVNGTYFGGDDFDTAGNIIWPVFTMKDGQPLTGEPDLDSLRSNSYSTGNDNSLIPGLASKVTISRWCSQCHDAWHEDDSEFGNKNSAHVASDKPGFAYNLDMRRHPVNSMVPRSSDKGCAKQCHHSLLDRKEYKRVLIQAGKGLPVTASSFYNGTVYYLPDCEAVSKNPCTGEMDDVAGNSNHRVFCLTCHFAHGGPNRDNLRWDYIQINDPDFGPGSQRGNPIETNVGCQLCHNR